MEKIIPPCMCIHFKGCLHLNTCTAIAAYTCCTNTLSGGIYTTIGWEGVRWIFFPQFRDRCLFSSLSSPFLFQTTLPAFSFPPTARSCCTLQRRSSPRQCPSSRKRPVSLWKLCVQCTVYVPSNNLQWEGSGCDVSEEDGCCYVWFVVVIRKALSEVVVVVIACLFVCLFFLLYGDVVDGVLAENGGQKEADTVEVRFVGVVAYFLFVCVCFTSVLTFTKMFSNNPIIKNFVRYVDKLVSRLLWISIGSGELWEARYTRWCACFRICIVCFQGVTLLNMSTVHYETFYKVLYVCVRVSSAWVL